MLFEQPITYRGHRKAEALVSLLDSLDRFEKIANACINSIQTRIHEERDKLNRVSSRIEVTERKIASITGTNKATVVFSLAKFPADARRPPIRRVFARGMVPGLKNRRELLMTKDYSEIKDVLERGYVGFDEEILTSEYGQMKGTTGESKEGLGRLPANLTTVSSLLLFNTEENPYKKYVSLDNLLGGLEEKKAGPRRGVLDEAPETILTGENLFQFAKVDYDFKPTMGDVPTFDLPQVIPDLDHVADLNLNIDLPEFQSIAPSHLQQELPRLPTVQVMSYSPKRVAQPALIRGESSPEMASSDSPAPPPPPPPPSAPPAPGSPTPSAPSAPPPPPPPGPPTQPASLDLPEAATADGRTDLMAEIRKKGGGQGLNKVEVVVKKENEPAEASLTGNDMMSELLRNITRRRVGMSGKIPEKKKRKKKTQVQKEVPSLPPDFKSPSTERGEKPAKEKPVEHEPEDLTLEEEEDDDDFWN